MKILVNNEAREIAGPSLADVVEQLGFGEAVIATAVDGDFVPARKRASVMLRDGHAVEVLAPMQGG
jgi:sulfur carrier protein